MSFLLDTNAFSEIVRDTPNPHLINWISGVDEDDLFISVLTVGEIKRGVRLLPAGAKRRSVETANDRLLANYADRVLLVDMAVAEHWADLSARYKTSGIVVGMADELLAATALSHGLTVVTRNVRHFEHSGCQLLSPWSA